MQELLVKNKLTIPQKIITNQENYMKIKRKLELHLNNLKKDSFTLEDNILTYPTNLNATSSDNTIILSFTEPYSNSEIINYLYSIDWGNFKAFSPAQNKSPIIIKNLENGVSYIISLKAVNNYGVSNSSNPISVFTGLLGFPNE